MQPYNRYSRLSFLLLLASASFFSCKKKKEDEPTPIVITPTPTPETPSNVYPADAANYAEATTLVAMFDELIDSTQAGNTVGRQVSSNQLTNMLNNSSNPFKGNLAKNSTLKISDYIDPNVKASLTTYFNDLATSSLATTYGDSNVAGVVLGTAATTGKLYDTKGFANYELIEKSLMGALQLYQITAVQLADSSFNSSFSSAKRVKKWDLAFGYLGVPKDYSNTTTGSLSFWANYLKTNDATLGGSILKIMTAFVNGRKASATNDNTNEIANAKIIKEELDKSAAGMSLTYLFRARKYTINLDKGRRNAGASEGVGFLSALKYHASRKITDSEINTALNTIGSNNWALSLVDIESAISTIATPYGFDANATTSKFNK